MDKTEEILAVLRQELREGHYVEGGHFSSEQKLMYRFKISRPTANRVTDRLVTEGFLRRGRHGAGTLVSNGSPFPLGTIACLGNVRHPYYAHIVDSVQRAVFCRNMAVSFFAPGIDLINYCIEQLSRSHYLGVLSSGYGLLPDDFPLPVVYLDMIPPASRSMLSSVSCTNYKGAFEMAEAVLSRGHREVLVCSNYSPVEYHRKRRVDGFLAALRKFGLKDADKRLFWTSNIGKSIFRPLLCKMLECYPDTTAILTDSDDLMLGIWNQARQMGCGHHITFTGFGNVSTISGIYGFPTVNQHPDEIGLQGVNELFQKLEHPDEYVPRIVEVDTELVNVEAIPWV